ncbi:hypothetical protein LP415_03610 [Polaromonas sp. P1(28)-8]|nr:hypothetical protein LP415_03610 [Polaromonas sp. P1(28)-8]
MLSAHAAIQFGMALVTEKDWSALLELCKDFKKQFDASPRLSAFEGLALDRLGRTADARAVLQEMLEKGISDSVGLKTYVNIMMRCGFIDEAIEAAERILENATKPAQKIECVKLLFNLIQISDPTNPQLVKLAIRMGELVDREDEVQEGVYLTMVLTGTMSSKVKVTPDELLNSEREGTHFSANGLTPRCFAKARPRSTRPQTKFCR